MNAPARIGRPIVTSADLRDAGQAERIDRFVHEHADGTPFHRPQWSRAVAAGTGCRAHYLLAEQGGAIVGVLPLSEIRSPMFGASLASAGFAVDGGVLALSTEAEAALVDAAVALAERLKCPTIELRGGPLPPFWHQSEGTYAGFARDLPQGEEAILKAIPRKQRAEVRKALDNQLDVAIGTDLASHYRVYAESVRNLGTPVFPRRLFREMLAAFGKDADITVISRGGELLSTVFSLYMNGIVYPYWGGGTAAARGARANELLYFALMKHAAERGCRRFDFGRSKFGTGAFAFKKNWGFEPQPLVYARWGEARETNPLSPKYRLQVAAWKRLPLWAANRIGPVIAKGLG
ncbi:MAG TPA: FemAB family XrtA/PEP-CTERM system-associated protein [Allosphingosinicella sp.]|nr:FemAB family XrtA/PEP-CTERM system-associated protein [Allosphingosinicella sp.]